jgi:hypothetical protein
MEYKTVDFQKKTSHSEAMYNLLEFLKEIRLTDFKSNPKHATFIFNSLQDDIKKRQIEKQPAEKVR